MSSGYGLSDTIRESDSATGRPIRAFGEPRRGKLTMALSKDGTLLASGEVDGAIRLWDMATGKEKRHWSTGPTVPSDVAFSPDGRTLASTAPGDSSIRLWDVATGQERHPPQEHFGPIRELRFSQDGKTLVSVGSDRRMLWWDVTKPLPQRQFSWKGLELAHQFALSPDRNMLADADVSILRTDSGPRIQLWDVRTGKPGLQLGNTKRVSGGLAFSPDGRLLASGEDSLVTLWDVRDGKEVRQIKGLPLRRGVPLLLARWDGPRGGPGQFQRCTRARTLRLYDVASGEGKSTFDVNEACTGLTFSPDGKVLAAGNGYVQDAFVRLWDIRTGSEICRYRGSSGVIAFSPNGKLVASGAGSLYWLDRSVHVWEAATGRLIHRFEGHHGDVGSVAFAPDGLSVASGGGDSTILLWDITGLRGDGRWQARPLGQRQLDAYWTALADEDAAKAYAAVWALTAAPEQAVPFLRKQLPPLPCADAKTTAKLIADLGSDEFRVRDKATKELSKLGGAAAPALRQALEAKPELEVRRRLQGLLDQVREWTPEHLREHRAIQALEHIGTQPVREVLRAVAEGAPEARRTEDAKEALRRLGR